MPISKEGHKLHYGDTLRFTACATQGGRKYMEDRVHIAVGLTESGAIDHHFFAVFDGHGGQDAAEFVRENLYTNLLNTDGFYSTRDSDITQALENAFLNTHQQMREVVGEWSPTASGYPSTSGTTATAALVRRGKLYIAHVGDSALIMGETKSKLFPVGGVMVTTEHKPNSDIERQRIEDLGGEVREKATCHRVVWRRAKNPHEHERHVNGQYPRPQTEDIPFLAVARSLGDLWSYMPDKNDYLVSPRPDVHVISLNETHRCMLLCSDGMLNVLRPQHIVDIINASEWRDFHHQFGLADVDRKTSQQILTRTQQENHARQLVRHTLRMWGNLRSDNISCIAVIFDPPSCALLPCAAVTYTNAKPEEIETILTDTPDAMIRTATCAGHRANIQILMTAPVNLVYNGSIDNPIGPGTRKFNESIAHLITQQHNRFQGPGFSVYAPDTKPFDHAASLAALNPKSLISKRRSELIKDEDQCTSMVKRDEPLFEDDDESMSLDHLYEDRPHAESMITSAVQSTMSKMYNWFFQPTTRSKSDQQHHQDTRIYTSTSALNGAPVGERKLPIRRNTITTTTDTSKGATNAADEHDDKSIFELHDRDAVKKYQCRLHGYACEKVMLLNQRERQSRMAVERERKRHRSGEGNLTSPASGKLIRSHHLSIDSLHEDSEVAGAIATRRKSQHDQDDCDEGVEASWYEASSTSTIPKRPLPAMSNNYQSLQMPNTFRASMRLQRSIPHPPKIIIPDRSKMKLRNKDEVSDDEMEERKLSDTVLKSADFVDPIKSMSRRHRRSSLGIDGNVQLVSIKSVSTPRTETANLFSSMTMRTPDANKHAPKLNRPLTINTNEDLPESSVHLRSAANKPAISPRPNTRASLSTTALPPMKNDKSNNQQTVHFRKPTKTSDNVSQRIKKALSLAGVSFTKSTTDDVKQSKESPDDKTKRQSKSCSDTLQHDAGNGQSSSNIHKRQAPRQEDVIMTQPISKRARLAQPFINLLSRSSTSNNTGSKNTQRHS